MQCAMPCFRGMFSARYDDIIQDMLWELATFHALSYLRLHTVYTLLVFDAAVITMGLAIRTFLSKVCDKVDTPELPKETESRKRRKQAVDKTAEVKISPKYKVLNLNTYKYHRLGDYPSAVREYGPLDGFSTQTVCCPPLVFVTCPDSACFRASLSTGA